MTTITDEYMKEKLAKTKPFTVVILKKGTTYKMPDVYPIIWEHRFPETDFKLGDLLGETPFR